MSASQESGDPLLRNCLLAESNPADGGPIREAIRQTLPQATLHIALTLAQARLMLMTVHPGLVVLDLNLATSSVRDFITAASERNGAVLVVVTAGHADDDRILPALRAGAAGYLLKYDAPETLSKQLRAALIGVLPLLPALARQILRHFDRTESAEALTSPERELLTWIAMGDTLVQAAARMQLRGEDIDAGIRHIYEKLKLDGARVGSRRVVEFRRHA